MNQTELAAELRRMAYRLEQPVEVPMGKISLAEAVKTLRKHFGANYFCLSMSIDCHFDGEIKANWAVGTVAKSYVQKPSLEEIIREVIQSDKKPKPDLDALQATLVGPQADPGPELMAIADEFMQGMAAPVEQEPPF